MKKLEIQTKIKNYAIDFGTKFESFKSKNEGREISVTMEVADTAQHFQYRYYHGFLLPDLADAYGVDVHYCHILCKREKLFIPVNSYDEIKKRHLANGVFMISRDDLMALPEWLPYSLIKGALIVHADNEIVGYCPSTSKKCFTKEEMAAYIESVEQMFTRDVQGSFKNHDEAMLMRNKAKER